MTTKTKLVQSIRLVYPDFQYENMRLNGGEGQFNHILIVDESIIFRFPRYAQQIKNLQREVNLLKNAAGQIANTCTEPDLFQQRRPVCWKSIYGL